MAQDGKEHKMLFDIRGRRRNVVKVIYATLAVLMGLSLLITVGPFSIGELFGNPSTGTSEAAERLEDEAAQIETKLVKEPGNEDLLLRLTRNQVSTANILAEAGLQGEVVINSDSYQQFQKANSSWNEYLEATDEPSTSAAQLMSTAMFTVASSGSPTFAEAASNVEAAAEAQQIVAEQRPNPGSLFTAALYTLYTFDYAKAEELRAEAEKLVKTKAERDAIDKQFKGTKKAAEEFEKEFKEVKKIEAQGGATGQQGAQEALRNPFSLGGTSSSE